YIVTATINGCSMKDTTVVTVFPITPTPTAGNTGPYCTGSDIQLTASTVAGASYTWTGPNSFSASTQNPQITPANATTAGVYTVYATANGCNSGTSNTNVTVVNGPTVNIYPSPNDTICGSPSGSATFTAVPAGSTGHSYQWYKNGIAITGATNSSYAATGILTGDEYSVKLIPGAGAPCTTPVNSNKIQMTVMPYIVPAVDITVSPDSNVWSGVMLTFTATVANAGNSPKYQWKLNGTNITGALSNTWGASNLSDKDKVSCEVTSSYICPQPQKVMSNVIGLRIKTGINNLEASNVKIYPNPTQTTLTVEGVARGTKIQLKDVLGRQVLHTTATQSKTVLNTAQLTAGNYLLILTTTDGEVMTAKVVKD
ncbi:MAG TPA: T9SS type A sorting domain-containing protein, partial [Flavipsychrobacter sp.]|nr:T9SS type A sorting domain-containing protein [Flavipsychrobacter sp.]